MVNRCYKCRVKLVEDFDSARASVEECVAVYGLVPSGNDPVLCDTCIVPFARWLRLYDPATYQRYPEDVRMRVEA